MWKFIKDDDGSKAIRLQNFRARVKPLAFIIICASLTLDIFNVTGLTYNQPDIALHFGVELSLASWSLSAYSLTFGSFLLLAGRAGDMYGHKNIYAFGLLFFSLFCLLVATIDSSFIAMCVVRALQGASAAATVPTAYAIIANSYEGKAQELAVAGLGLCTTSGAVIGSVIGGAFATTSLGYRGMLWLSFGLGLICTGLAFLVIEPPSRNETLQRKTLDYIGSFIVTAAAAILVYGFTEAPTGWRQAKVIAPIVIGGVLFIVFFVWEQYFVERLLPNIDPLIPSRVWGYHNLLAVTVQTGFMYGAFFLVVLNSATFLIRVQGHGPLISSVMLVPIAGGSIFFIMIFGPLYNHKFLPPKWMLVFSAAMLLIGTLIFSRNGVHEFYWRYSFSGTIIIALGVCNFFINYLNIVYASAPPEDQGLISGIVQTVAQVSTGVAFAIGSSFITSDEPEALLREYRKSFYVSMAFAGVGGLVALVFVKPLVKKVGKSGSDVESLSVREEVKSDGEQDLQGQESKKIAEV